MGASWRAYPRSGLRQGLIDRLNAKPEGERSGDDWWRLGEHQVLEGLSAGDEAAINAGSQALMKGAHLTPAHAGCLLDLGWLLCYKGLDQMALFYLDKAAEAVPTSRDVWTLRGWACIGSGSREQAIDSFRRAVSKRGGAWSLVVRRKARLGMLQSLVWLGASPAWTPASGSVAAACDDLAVQTQGCIKGAAQAFARVGLLQHGQLAVEGAAQAVELVLAVALRTGGLFGEQAVLLQRQDDGFRLVVVGHQQAACAVHAAHDATPTLALDVRHRFAGNCCRPASGAGWT